MPKVVEYYLKKEMSFKDKNSVGTDIPLKKISDIISDGWVKVETIEEHNMKRIFWAQENDLIKKK